MGVKEVNKTLEKSFDITNEDKLLLLCAKTQKIPINQCNIKKLLTKNLDWDYLTQRAREHKLLPLLYWNLKEFQEEIPENIFNSLKLNFDENARENLLMLGELFKLVDLFKKADINVIPYKGPLLAILAYKNLVFRQFDDLDIFINKDDVLKAKSILISNGYKPQFDLEGFKERRFIKTQREYKFIKHETMIYIEVQWQFQGVSFSLSDDIDFMDSKNIEIIKIHNKEISSLSPENLFLILCIHASGHYWDRLSWICDISELIQSHEINWDYIIEKGNQLGIIRLILVTLLLAVDLLDLNLPNNILKQLKSEIIEDLTFNVKKRIFLRDDESIFQSAYIRYNIREKRSHRIKDILKILFLPTNEEWNNSTLKPLFPPISYIYRFIRVLRY